MPIPPPARLFSRGNSVSAAERRVHARRENKRQPPRERVSRYTGSSPEKRIGHAAGQTETKNPGSVGTREVAAGPAPVVALAMATDCPRNVSNSLSCSSFRFDFQRNFLSYSSLFSIVSLREICARSSNSNDIDFIRSSLSKCGSVKKKKISEKFQKLSYYERYRSIFERKYNVNF